jgi:hypothetical protein
MLAVIVVEAAAEVAVRARVGQGSHEEHEDEEE